MHAVNFPYEELQAKKNLSEVETDLMRYSYGGKNLNLHFAEFFNLRYATLI